MGGKRVKWVRRMFVRAVAAGRFKDTSGDYRRFKEQWSRYSRVEKEILMLEDNRRARLEAEMAKQPRQTARLVS